MNCDKCSKVSLLDCNDCDFTVNADCVDYTGDRFDFEDAYIKNGSSRTVSSILEGLINSLNCKNRTTKIVTGDYTFLEEDGCNIILLDGDVEDVDVDYSLILPQTDEFKDKVLIVKDISSYGDPSGVVTWTFNNAITYDWQDNLSTTDFATLADTKHRVLYLAFIKTGLSYEWVVLSNATKDIIRTEIPDGDMVNSWVTSITVSRIKNGKHISLEGSVTGGTDCDTAFTLPEGYRPMINTTFICAVDGSPWLALVSITTSGAVTISVPGGCAAPVTDNVFLDGISFYTE